MCRMRKKKIDKLMKNFKKYSRIGKEGEIFAYSADHFYAKILKEDKKKISIRFKKDFYFEYLYAGLISWKLERKKYLVEYEDFKKQIKNLEKDFKQLENKRIEKITDNQELKNICDKLKKIFNKLNIKKDQISKVIPNSKLMHFILPNLVPPIDNRYTSRVFYFSIGDIKDFLRIFKKFVEICNKIGTKKIVKMARKNKVSVPKLIDDAIIGWSL